MAERKYRVLGRGEKDNNVLQVFRLAKGFTRNPDNPEVKKVGGNAHLFTKAEVQDAIKWGHRNGVAVFGTTNEYPFLVKQSDTEWGSPELSKKMNELGRRRRRYIHVTAFKRTARQQWVLRMAYLRGEGNLAARCCSRYDRQLHSWNQCGKDSWSNHFRGNAADIGVIVSGRDGSRVNVGDDSKCRKIMKSLGLALVVPHEPWHCEIGGQWLA